jgi:TM2 domain-containing membrane protein YozV
MATGMGDRGKNKVVAGVLALLLGWLGVHHFYLGSTGAGIIDLLLSCFVGFGWVVAAVEGVMLLVMDDAEFDARYNRRTPESMEFVFLKPKTLA